jgi:hypothetical protein
MGKQTTTFLREGNINKNNVVLFQLHRRLYKEVIVFTIVMSYTNTKGNWSVLDPSLNYRNKSTSEWVSDWFNWFLSADADKRNSGPVVFLRSLGLPNRITLSSISDTVGPVSSTDLARDSLGGGMGNYTKSYVNDPNIRIGGDRLQIFQDQRVLVPIIIAYWLKTEPQSDWGIMQEYTGLTIDNGDNPPEPRQLTINEKSLPEKTDMTIYRTITPMFPAVVPDVEFGRSIKDFLEHPVQPGIYPAIVEGFFVMLKFEEPGDYWVHAWASVPREVSGPYFSEMLYQVEVLKGSRIKVEHQGRVTRCRPSRNERIFDQILTQKERYGDLTDEEKEKFTRYFRAKDSVGRRTRVPLCP